MTTLAIHNPANGEKIADVPADDAASVAAKAALARAAQAGWAARPLAERQECIARFRDGVVRDLEKLAVTMTRETGKPIKMSRNELNGLLGRLDFFVGMVEPVTATETVYDEGGMRERIEHVPLGVVGQHLGLELPVVRELQRDRAGAADRQRGALQAFRIRDAHGAGDRPPAA